MSAQESTQPLKQVSCSIYSDANGAYLSFVMPGLALANTDKLFEAFIVFSEVKL
jgi:hypothetical protein